MPKTILRGSPLYTGELKRTPIGDLWLAMSDLGLAAVEWGKSQADFESYLVKRFRRSMEYKPKMVAQAASELREYLKGKRRAFTLVIDWTGDRAQQARRRRAGWRSALATRARLRY